LRKQFRLGFSEEEHLHEALAAYERKRNQTSAEEYHENLPWAGLELPSPDVLRVPAALRGTQQQINRFTMARTGMIPRNEGFSPENMTLLSFRPNDTKQWQWRAIDSF
jgi:hypothetical protein